MASLATHHRIRTARPRIIRLGVLRGIQEAEATPELGALQGHRRGVRPRRLAREKLRREHLECLVVVRIQAAGRCWRRRTLHLAERSEDGQKIVAGGICAREDMG